MNIERQQMLKTFMENVKRDLKIAEATDSRTLIKEQYRQENLVGEYLEARAELTLKLKELKINLNRKIREKKDYYSGRDEENSSDIKYTGKDLESMVEIDDEVIELQSEFDYHVILLEVIDEAYQKLKFRGKTFELILNRQKYDAGN